jgi:hypothetical protein
MLDLAIQALSWLTVSADAIDESKFQAATRNIRLTLLCIVIPDGGDFARRTNEQDALSRIPTSTK